MSRSLSGDDAVVTGLSDDYQAERRPRLRITWEVPRALRRVLEQLTGMLPITGCWAVILHEPAELRFVAAADPVARRMQALEAERGAGPTLHAAWTGEQVLLGDLRAPAAVDRFPWFASEAVAAGVTAVYSFPLYSADQRIGGLSVCSNLPVQGDPVDLDLAQLLVDLAAASITGARRDRQPHELAVAIERHLADTAVLEQAKGRLSIYLGVDTDTAYQSLQRYAARTGEPLHDVAARVAAGMLRLRR